MILCQSCFARFGGFAAYVFHTLHTIEPQHKNALASKHFCLWYNNIVTDIGYLHN